MGLKPTIAGILGLLVAFSGCTWGVLPPRPDYEQQEPGTACAGLCSVLVEHECPGWRGNPGPDERFGTADDVGCEDQCLRSVGLASWMLDKASCGAAARNCAEIDSCMSED
jgi:hypothetical protein